MNRNLFKIGAVAGVVSVAALAAGPALAAGSVVSQATAQSADVSIAGTSAVSQEFTATNDGSKETTNNASTLPDVLTALPGNNLLGLTVAPQSAGANKDGTSYACAGVGGPGSGVANVGTSSCAIDGKVATLDLGSLNLGDALLGQDSALGSALNGLPVIGDILTLVGGTLNQLVSKISTALAATPLGKISVGGVVNAIYSSCTADPTKATGDAHLVNATGIGVTIPTATGGTQTINLVQLPANPPPNTHLLTNLDTVTQTVVDAVTAELNTALNGELSKLGLGKYLQTAQDALIKPLVAALQPLLKPLQADLLDITLNKQSTSDNGKKIDITALDGQILPLAAAATGSSLISLQLGHVTCGPNARVASNPTPSPTPTSTPTNGHHTPTNVDSGLAGNTGHANAILAGTAAMLALCGVGGTLAYRRYGMPRG